MNNYIITEITDTDYYYMIENQIRTEMPKFEAGILLPRAIELFEESGVAEEELKDYPIEGYYYKSGALKHYFTLIRNLQHNKDIFSKIKKNKRLEYLQHICHQDIWGEEKQYPIRDYDNAPLKRRYDILTLTMEDKNLFNPNMTRPWSIDLIMSGLSKHYKNRINLVELAYLTKNPKCLCCGAETNALYRMFGMVTGCLIIETQYVWKVSSEVQNLGEKLIDSYNNLIGSNMIKPNIFNHTQFKKEAEKPRVALLGNIRLTGENYYWILDSQNYLSEKYTTEVITTEMVTKNEVSKMESFKV